MEIRVNGDFKDIDEDIDLLKSVIDWTCEQIKLSPRSVDIILVDDETLRELHKIYLNDDTKTDVMTFNLGDENSIESEIYISLTRAEAQAAEFDVSLIEEIIRLLIHACLHLAGYDDQEEVQRIQMKKAEDQYVTLACKRFLN